MNAGTNAGGMFTGGLPKGELLGRYRSYEDAQKVVDHLTAAEDFDVKALTVVGNDLRSVEHIRTRLTYPRVALGGAAQGAMFGAFIGLLIYLFSPESSVYNLAFSVVLGMAIWMMIGVIGFAMRKGKREYASSSQLVATTFDVVCEFSAAPRARHLVPGAQVASLNADNDPTSQPSARLTPAQEPSAPAQPGSAPAHQPSGHQGSGGVQAGDQETTTATESTPEQPVAGYNDLPDGRPRYGVRMPATEESAEQPQGSRDPQRADSQEQVETDAPLDRPDRAEADATRAGPEDPPRS